jgi:hypothetical protein
VFLLVVINACFASQPNHFTVRSSKLSYNLHQWGWCWRCIFVPSEGVFFKKVQDVE